MFNRDDKNSKETETIVGASVVVRGDFHGKGNIIIEGTLEGSLFTEGALFAGENSVITADIKAKEAKILGTVKGEISLAGLLELGPQSIIEGDIKVGRLSVENGAQVNGKIIMQKHSESGATKTPANKE